MSKFYGTLVGDGNPRTARGTERSGIRASAQSYDGSVIVEMRYSPNGELMVKASCRDGSVSTIGSEAWEGTFADFRKLLRRSACRRNTRS